MVEAYEAELERSKSPDYKPQSFDEFDDYEMELAEVTRPRREPAAAVPTANAGVVEVPRLHRRKRSFGDYNSLIADLKRDAADRRQTGGTGPSPCSQDLASAAV